MKRIELFESALEDCRALEKRFGSAQSPPWIIEQLEYLIAFERGQVRDRGKLDRMTIGILTAREVEGMDMGVAEKLYLVCAEIEKMISGR